MSKTFANKSSYPLEWPPGIARSKRPESSRFSTTLFQALENVEKALKKLASDSGKKIGSVVLSSNVTLGDMKPDDGGVAVYFNWDGVEMCYPIDRYKKVEENLQAIHHIIEADRTKLRHGSFEFIMAEKQGKHAMLPESGSGAKWWEVLGVVRTASMEQIKSAYRSLAKLHHPDAGGSGEQFQLIQEAFRQAKMGRE